MQTTLCVFFVMLCAVHEAIGQFMSARYMPWLTLGTAQPPQRGSGQNEKIPSTTEPMHQDLPRDDMLWTALADAQNDISSISLTTAQPVQHGLPQNDMPSITLGAAEPPQEGSGQNEKIPEPMHQDLPLDDMLWIALADALNDIPSISLTTAQPVQHGLPWLTLGTAQPPQRGSGQNGKIPSTTEPMHQDLPQDDMLWTALADAQNDIPSISLTTAQPVQHGLPQNDMPWLTLDTAQPPQQGSGQNEKIVSTAEPMHQDLPRDDMLWIALADALNDLPSISLTTAQPVQHGLPQNDMPIVPSAKAQPVQPKKLRGAVGESSELGS